MVASSVVLLAEKCFDLSEEERDHGLGAVEVNYGEHWFPEFLDEVLRVLDGIMTDEERAELRARTE